MGIAIMAGARRAAVAAVLLTALLLLGCSGTDAGGDGGADAGASSDSGSDGGADTETGAECGAWDLPCCTGDPACLDGWLPVDDLFEGCICYEECTPAECVDDLDVWAADFVACQYLYVAFYDVGGCITIEDWGTIDDDCDDPDGSCTTSTGYPDGICAWDGANYHCLRLCEPSDDDCGIDQTCLATYGPDLEYTGAACVPKD